MTHEIFQKEIIYRTQMADVREAVLRFIHPKGWETQNRGRRAHVSVFGPVSGMQGVIDIMMEETDWNTMPESLQPNTAFSLWCSAHLDRDGIRHFADTEIYWRAPFESLTQTVGKFLVPAWEMLSALNDSNLLLEWPGPSTNPDRPPSFGPARRRGTER